VKRVLIVDDEPLIRSGLSKALKGLAVVETADSGAQAMACIAARFYDVCFLDLLLPDIGGLDVMRRIRKTSPNTKVAIMTAYANEAMAETIRREADRFLEKPLDLSQIREIVASPSSQFPPIVNI
jgi:DNA-binding NtrC family response regulator